MGPPSDSTIEEMDAYADDVGFPTVGPDVGGWLSLLTRLVGAQSVFEFGSGFGYSAYWFARALPDDGEIILTERDPENLDRAREYLSSGGYLDQVTLEQGDAIEIIDQYGDPFDVVLIDNEKHRYREAFESIRDQVSSGGIVVADNAMTSSQVHFDDLVDFATGHDIDLNESTQGIANYLGTVTDDPAFETAILPLGEGVAVSHRQ
jgi:caffeoyl-CoA O-methyltransferase